MELLTSYKDWMRANKKNNHSAKQIKTVVAE